MSQEAPERHRNPASRRAWAAALGVVAAAAVVLLFLRGGSGSDPAGDVRSVGGSEADDTAGAARSLADILDGDVRRIDEGIVFEATMAEEIPDELDRSSLELRFDLSEGGRDTWIVSASVNVAATASVVSQATAYSSTTIDGSMPGSVEISGDTISIVLDPAGVDDFPERFDWVLTAKLTAVREVPGSLRFEDRYPDEGTLSGP